MAGKKGAINPHNDRQRIENVRQCQAALAAILASETPVRGRALWNRDQAIAVLRDRITHADSGMGDIATWRGETKNVYAGAVARAIKYGERMREGKDR